MSEQVNLLDEKYQKVSGFLDGELTQQEAQKIAMLIESDPSYQQLYQELSCMRVQVQSLSLQEQELQHLDKLFQEPVAKTSRLIGFILLSAGALLAVGYTLFQIFSNPDIPLLEKILVGAMGSGSLLLLVSVLRQRLISSKNDKYNRVKL